VPLCLGLSIFILFRKRISVGQESSQLTSKRLEDVSTGFTSLGAGKQRGILGRSRMSAERS
jgi:hypothetical protein